MNWRKQKSDKNVIRFKSRNDVTWNVKERPIPAVKMLPDWWHDIPNYTNNALSIDLDPRPNVTVKRCISVLDGLGSGYIMPLWTDIKVNYTKETGTYVKWNTKSEVFGIWHSSQVAGYKIPESFQEPVFKFFHDWIIETPPGWSCLIIQPLGYPNLPFRVIPGIVDTDKLKTEINTPIVFKVGWEGIIPKGTPMFQIIPIKRSNWESQFVQGSEAQYNYDMETLKTKIVSYYGRYLRVPKVFK